MKEKIGYRQGGVSILTNILLFALKIWAGIVTGSLALIADAWHTLSDSLSSVIVIASIKLASRKPDRKHPFGYGRWEQIAAIFIAVMLAGVGIEIIREAVSKFSEKNATNYGLPAIIVTIISILVKELLAQYAFHCYRKTGFETLRADGWHHRSDSLSSILILVGIFLRPYIWWIDSFLGGLVSLFLLYAAYRIVRNSVGVLLGEEVPETLIERLKICIDRVAGKDVQPHHFHLHNYGNHQELTLHIRLPNKMSIGMGHELATKIEALVRKEMNIECTVHVEPLNGIHKGSED